jgi:hypothetical protein
MKLQEAQGGDFQCPCYEAKADGLILSWETMPWFWRESRSRAHVASALNAASPSGMNPTAYVHTGMTA